MLRNQIELDIRQLQSQPLNIKEALSRGIFRRLADTKEVTSK